MQAKNMAGAMPSARSGKLSTPSRIRNSVMPAVTTTAGMPIRAPEANALMLG